MSQFIRYLPIITFIFAVAECFVRPLISREIRVLKAFREYLSEDSGESRIKVYTTLQGKMEDKLAYTASDTEKEQIMDNILEIERERARIETGTQEGDGDIIVQAVSRAILTKSVHVVLGSLISVLIVNLGFLIILITGSFIGTIVSLFTMVGSAYVTDRALSNDQEFSSISANQGARLAVYATITSIVMHLPFLLSLIIWN